MTARDAKQPPSVVLRRDGHGSVITCPYCHKEHRHGPAPCFKPAHCPEDKEKLGYFIVDPPTIAPGPAARGGLNPWDHGDAMILAGMGEAFRVKVAKLLHCGHEAGPCHDCWRRAKDVLDEVLP